MKDETHVGVVKQNTHIGVSNRTPTLVYVTRLCAVLVLHVLLSAMVLGAPSNGGLGSSTDYRFTYNTNDVYVDRVCRRVPVLLDPRADLPCRIVDTDCIVDEPCVTPDPLDRLLSIAPCPPIWNPALVCSLGSGAKLECTEKFKILWKCFLSPNRTIYNLTTREESCKLKSACGLWLNACSDEFFRLSDVFASCTVPHRPDIESTDNTTITMSRTTHVTNSGNTTNTTYHVVRTDSLVPEPELDVHTLPWAVIAILAGILAPVCSMCFIAILCRELSKRKTYVVAYKGTTCELHETPHGHVDSIVGIEGDIDVSTETTPFLVDDHKATRKSKLSMELSQDTEIKLEFNLETEKPGISTTPQQSIVPESHNVPQEITACFGDDQVITKESKVSKSISQEISESEIEAENGKEKSTEDIQTNNSSDERSVVDVENDKMPSSDTVNDEAKLEPEGPGISTVLSLDTGIDEAKLEPEGPRLPTVPSLDTGIDEAKLEPEGPRLPTVPSLDTGIDEAKLEPVGPRLPTVPSLDTGIDEAKLEPEGPRLPTVPSLDTGIDEAKLEPEGPRILTAPQNSTVQEVQLMYPETSETNEEKHDSEKGTEDNQTNNSSDVRSEVDAENDKMPSSDTGIDGPSSIAKCHVTNSEETTPLAEDVD